MGRWDITDKIYHEKNNSFIFSDMGDNECLCPKKTVIQNNTTA
jgi:hypothetical protein